MFSSDLAIRVGRLIRKMRLERGLSQEAFAAMCNLHRTYVGPVERGKKNVTLKTAEKMAQALGVRLSIILRQAEDDSSAADD